MYLNLRRWFVAINNVIFFVNHSAVASKVFVPINNTAITVSSSAGLKVSRTPMVFAVNREAIYLSA